MMQNGQRPDMGLIVVTGATGGVGSIAIDLFTAAGFEVHAITGKVEQFDYLQALGAKQCVQRQTLQLGGRPLEAATWAGAVERLRSISSRPALSAFWRAARWGALWSKSVANRN